MCRGLLFFYYNFFLFCIFLDIFSEISQLCFSSVAHLDVQRSVRQQDPEAVEAVGQVGPADQQQLRVPAATPLQGNQQK